MKNLLYKDLTLVNSISLMLLMALFVLLPLIPNYPDAATFIYLIVFYPMIFLGANKGTQNNDVYFSLTLPVSRKKIINARLITLSIMQGAMLLVSILTIYIGSTIEASMNVAAYNPEGMESIGLGFEGILSLYGFGFASLAILDLIFIPLFYKTGKSFGVPFTIGSIVYGIVITLFAIVLPSAVPAFYNFFNVWNPLIQILTFVIGLLIYIGLRFITSILATKAFEKVDL